MDVHLQSIHAGGLLEEKRRGSGETVVPSDVTGERVTT